MSWKQFRRGSKVIPAAPWRRFCLAGLTTIRTFSCLAFAALFLFAIGQSSVGSIDFSAGFGRHVDDTGHAYYITPPVDDHGHGMSSGGSASAAPYPLEDTFSLHSLPGASKVIYLDFDGHDGDPSYDFDGNHASFSDPEREEIQRAWQRAAEDFIPFEVDVTTEFPGLEALRKAGSGDQQWGVRVVIHPGDGTSGGWAFVGSFDWSSDQPAYVDTNGVGTGSKNVAEVISHEAGHTLGLSHDGWDADGVRDPDTGWDEEYYGGHGNGATGWAPIMGVGYHQPVTQWSRGEYDGATNTQDDLAIITTQNGFGYRPDDHGSSPIAASDLNHLAGIVLLDEGIIGRNTDRDFFQFTVGTDGPVDLTIEPIEVGPNLDVKAILLDAVGGSVAVSDPLGELGADFHIDLTAGDYYLQIEGTGTGDPTAAYNDYGSLGSYSITGTAFTDLAGDINLDNQVDYGDIEAFITGWRTTGHATLEEQVMHGDLNFDGFTNLADWHILRQAMIASGNGSYASGFSIPEPSTYFLAIITIGFALFRRPIDVAQARHG